MKKAITIRGIDKTTYDALKKYSQKAHISMNAFLLNLLKSRLGTTKPEANRDFDEFLGSWKPKEHQEFLKSIQCFETVDKEFWS